MSSCNKDVDVVTATLCSLILTLFTAVTLHCCYLFCKGQSFIISDTGATVQWQWAPIITLLQTVIYTVRQSIELSIIWMSYNDADRHSAKTLSVGRVILGASIGLCGLVLFTHRLHTCFANSVYRVSDTAMLLYKIGNAFCIIGLYSIIVVNFVARNTTYFLVIFAISILFTVALFVKLLYDFETRLLALVAVNDGNSAASPVGSSSSVVGSADSDFDTAVSRPPLTPLDKFNENIREIRLQTLSAFNASDRQLLAVAAKMVVIYFGVFSTLLLYFPLRVLATRFRFGSRCNIVVNTAIAGLFTCICIFTFLMYTQLNSLYQRACKQCDRNCVKLTMFFATKKSHTNTERKSSTSVKH